MSWQRLELSTSRRTLVHKGGDANPAAAATRAASPEPSVLARALLLGSFGEHNVAQETLSKEGQESQEGKKRNASHVLA